MIIMSGNSLFEPTTALTCACRSDSLRLFLTASGMGAEEIHVLSPITRIHARSLRALSDSVRAYAKCLSYKHKPVLQ